MNLTPVFHKAASDVLNALPEEVRTDNEGFNAISSEWVEPLTIHLQLFLAHIIAGILDAGSERDAVMDNDDLRDAIANELRSWAK